MVMVFTEYIKKYLGEPAWSVKRTYGSCFSIHLGEHHSIGRNVLGVSRNISHGDFNILILSDNWTGKYKKDKCNSHCSEPEIDCFLKKVEGKNILDVIVTDLFLKILFNDVQITVFNHDSDSDLAYFSCLNHDGRPSAMWSIDNKMQVKVINL
jgi:hypothetical protein